MNEAGVVVEIGGVLALASRCCCCCCTRAGLTTMEATPENGNGGEDWVAKEPDPVTRMQLHMERTAHAFAELLESAGRGHAFDAARLPRELDKALDMVDEMPGAGKTKEEQMRELRELAAEDAAMDEALREARQRAQATLRRVGALRESVVKAVLHADHDSQPPQ